MSLFQLLTATWNREDRLLEMVDRLAQQCVAGVRDRLGQSVYHMSRYESRGYVRSRASLVVKRAVHAAAQVEPIAVSDLPRVQSLVLQSTTHLVHQQLVSQPWKFAARRAA